MSNKVLGNLKKGLLFIISAPAGTGKTTLAKMLQDEFSCVASSISCTTRAPREGEVNGKDYIFLSAQEFTKKLDENAFLEHANLFHHSYGTLKETVDDLQSSGKHVLLVIDTQGMRQIKQHNIPCTSIFLTPPSWEELKHRLQGRGSESAEEIDKRIRWAHAEIAFAHLYDYHIVNDDLTTAYQTLRSILIVEENKQLRKAQPWNI